MDTSQARAALFGIVIVAGLALTGCTFSASTSVSVPASEVESQAASALEPQLGFLPEVSCPEDLPATLDHTMACELVDQDGTTYVATITVTAVDGTDVDFDVTVG